MGIIEKLGIEKIFAYDMNQEDDDMCFSKPVRDLEKQRDEMLEALIWFCKDAEASEVMSRMHYVKFIVRIEKACYPKTWEQIKELINE